jgi:hypothetical protein
MHQLAAGAGLDALSGVVLGITKTAKAAVSTLTVQLVSFLHC